MRLGVRQKSARTKLTVASLTEFLPEKRGGVQGVARRVDSDEVSSFIQVILEGALALFVQDYTGSQPTWCVKRDAT